MMSKDEILFNTLISIENKDLFIDLKKNSSGMFLKMSERKDNLRKSIIIPASGIEKFRFILDHVLKINDNETQKSRENDNRPIIENKVYVMGLPWTTDEHRLSAHFASIGNVVNASIIRRGRRGKIVSIGRGTVEFETFSAAEMAIQQFNHTEFDGRLITCAHFKGSMSLDGTSDSRGSSTDRSDIHPASNGTTSDGTSNEKYSPLPSRQIVTNKVFVKSLSWNTVEDELRQFFSQVGIVLSAEIRKTSHGKSAGNGVVEFSQSEAVEQAINVLNHSTLNGRVISVLKYNA